MAEGQMIWVIQCPVDLLQEPRRHPANDHIVHGEGAYTTAAVGPRENRLREAGCESRILILQVGSRTHPRCPSACAKQGVRPANSPNRLLRRGRPRASVR